MAPLRIALHQGPGGIPSTTDRTLAALDEAARSAAASGAGLRVCGSATTWSSRTDRTQRGVVWGVMKHFGSATDPANPGPGDVYDDMEPVGLDED